MNKIVSTKTPNAIFLAIVLVAGTITLFSPSFIVEAQAEPYGMDDIYGYSDYRDDKDKKYDSYGPPVYGMDSSYDDKKSYGKDDSRDKSIKDSKSISINKINCINTNLNINGNNAGNVSIGNKGTTAGGYSGGYSSTDGNGGYNGNAGYYGNGYDNNKQGKGFDCRINNNNINTNIVIGGGGNVTDGNGNVTACEECFFNITQNEMQLNRLLTAAQVTSIGEYCDRLASTPNSSQETQSVILALHIAFASPIPPEQNDSINVIIECLIDARVIGPR